jgi:hypothetical protein
LFMVCCICVLCKRASAKRVVRVVHVLSFSQNARVSVCLILVTAACLVLRRRGEFL